MNGTTEVFQRALDARLVAERELCVTRVGELRRAWRCPGLTKAEKQERIDLLRRIESIDLELDVLRAAKTR